jgi:alpha,alpha-trehalase
MPGGQAVAKAGAYPLLDDAVRLVADRLLADGSRMVPAYTIDGWRAAEAAITAIEQRWHEPDAGIWELKPDNWTHSRLICVAGLRAIATHQPSERGAPWVALADVISAQTGADSLHPSGRWQRSPGDPRVDASLLLPAIRGAISPDDPRSLATLVAIEDELTDDGYCYRFRPDERPLGEAEGAFLLCGFLMALAHAPGRPRARRSVV